MSTDEFIKQSLTNIVKAIKNHDETRLVAHISALKFLIHLMDNASIDTLLPDIMSLVTSPSRDIQRRGVAIIKELGISPGEFAAQMVITMETVNAPESSQKRSLNETDKEQNPKRKVPARLGTVTPVSRAAGIQPSIPPVDDDETDCED